MANADLHLQDLAQTLAQKQAELDEARRAYEARLADLTRRKDELQSALHAVDAEIQAVSGTSVPNTTTTAAPPPTPARASESESQETPTLYGLLVDLVRSAGRPITAKELADEVVRMEFPTTSGNIPKMVKNKVSELVTKGVLLRAEGQSGVVLAQPSAKKPAATAKATRPGQTAGQNGTAAPSPETPATPAARAGKVSLRNLLMRLLASAKRPLKAKELAERALAAGYQTESRDFVNVVWVALGKMDVENVPGQGYRLKKGSANAK